MRKIKVFFSLYESAKELSRISGKRYVVFPYSGYAHAEDQLFRSLRKIGVYCTRDIGEAENCDIELYFGQPNKYPITWPVRRPTIILTMFETTAIPSDWVDVINSFDFVFNPSSWGKQTFADCGVEESKIHVLPLGFNQKRFSFQKRKDRNKKWTFLWRGLGIFDRKGWKLVESAFRELNLPDSRVVCKTAPQKAVNTRMDLVVTPRFASEKWDWIRFNCSYLSWEDMIAMIAESDVSLNPSSGEGWGLIPLEDAATGCMTVLTDWSGLAEFSHLPGFIPLKYQIGPSFYFRHNLGLDAKPDFSHLKELMVWSYENRADARHLGYLASKSVKRFTWEQSALLYREKLLELVL